MSERFYVNLPLAIGPFLLDGPEAHHLATVCRLRPGAEVCLFNGDGREYPARVTRSKREVTLYRVRRTPEWNCRSRWKLRADSKGDRAVLIEKLTGGRASCRSIAIILMHTRARRNVTS